MVSEEGLLYKHRYESLEDGDVPMVEYRDVVEKLYFLIEFLLFELPQQSKEHFLVYCCQVTVGVCLNSGCFQLRLRN